ncbi:hypothetical protein A2U01_0084312, partial [Trifolium medium]|nr:hypothetical protein [Trifolium medium]
MAVVAGSSARKKKAK